MRLHLLILALLTCGLACGDEWVEGYRKSDGTYVASHYRSDKDESHNNNWSTEGNINPHNGREGYIPRRDEDYVASQADPINNNFRQQKRGVDSTWLLAIGMEIKQIKSRFGTTCTVSECQGGDVFKDVVIRWEDSQNYAGRLFYLLKDEEKYEREIGPLPEIITSATLGWEPPNSRDFIGYQENGWPRPELDPQTVSESIRTGTAIFMRPVDADESGIIIDIEPLKPKKNH